MNFDKVYVCQFGCEGEFTNKGDIAMHLIMDHKSKEVSVWGYKKDKLKKLLTREQLATVLNAQNIDEDTPFLTSGCKKQDPEAYKKEKEYLR
jgi:hypothetical protein